MINKANQIKFLTLIALMVGFAWANLQEVSGQTRDPFEKAPALKPKPPAGQNPAPGKDSSAAKPAKPLPPPVVPVGVPAVQDRINYYKERRRIAAENGEPLPKVTGFLTLNEMSVSGIFKTPRGYAAMIQATPINLAYTIYPGEKFFDGQLVAIEENRLVFRKVVKMSNGKFISSEENKTLREYSQQEELQGTAPADATAKAETKPADSTAQTATAQPTDPTKPVVSPVSMISPLDEMNKPPVETPKSAKDKGSNKKGKSAANKKPAKVAANKKE
jgi:hypothetical protein